MVNFRPLFTLNYFNTFRDLLLWVSLFVSLVGKHTVLLVKTQSRRFGRENKLTLVFVIIWDSFGHSHQVWSRFVPTRGFFSMSPMSGHSLLLSQPHAQHPSSSCVGQCKAIIQYYFLYINFFCFPGIKVWKYCALYNFPFIALCASLLHYEKINWGNFCQKTKLHCVVRMNLALALYYLVDTIAISNIKVHFLHLRHHCNALNPLY